MMTRILQPIVAAILSSMFATSTSAEQTPAPITAIATRAVPAPSLAAVFELKLQLPQGQGLARLLLDVGVTGNDAAEAAKLAAGRCTDAGCAAKVAISRNVDGSGLRIERLVLIEASGQTVIERRNDRLALNPAAVATTKAAALI